MSFSVIVGWGAAILLIAVVFLFGQLFIDLFAGEKHAVRVAEVELLSETEQEEEREEPKVEQVREQVETEPEAPPDAAEVLENLELAPIADDAPALDAASLGALGQLLEGGASGDDFGMGANLDSGGRIGGTGSAFGADLGGDGAFELADIDQEARAVDQVAPQYPAELRRQKLEGNVLVKFIVTAEGKVEKPKVLESDHPAFVKPALEALRRWQFEPAVRGGKRVASFKKLSILFKPAP